MAKQAVVTVRITDAELLRPLVEFAKMLAETDPMEVEEPERLAQNWHLEALEIVERLVEEIDG